MNRPASHTPSDARSETLAPALVERYRRDGFLNVPGVFETADSDRLRRLVYRLYRKFRPADTTLDTCAEPWRSPAFDAAMIALRSQSPREFGALYDCAQGSVELLSFFTQPRLLEIVSACLGGTPGGLSYSGIMLRMDPPRDTRNAIDWHQDRAYYPQNADGHHGLVATLALRDIDASSGALKLCPGSHRLGLVEPVARGKEDYETTEQRAVPAELVSQFAPVDPVVACGDLLLMDLNLFHRSGSNVRSHVRYSALCRFHRVMADDYVPFGLIYQFNDFMLDRQARDHDGR